ncbi:MAG: hypothetical protein KAI24_10715 [Planctomycetes bacterium]|nr:hypothetical protein [Planctomycetota bacterium]
MSVEVDRIKIVAFAALLLVTFVFFGCIGSCASRAPAEPSAEPSAEFEGFSQAHDGAIRRITQGRTSDILVCRIRHIQDPDVLGAGTVYVECLSTSDLLRIGVGQRVPLYYSPEREIEEFGVDFQFSALKTGEVRAMLVEKRLFKLLLRVPGLCVDEAVVPGVRSIRK